MKKIRFLLFVTILSFAVIIAAFNLIYSDFCNNQKMLFNVSAGRITDEISAAYENRKDLQSFADENFNKWKKEYGDACPLSIEVVPINKNSKDVFLITDISDNITCGIHGEKGLEYLVCYGFDYENEKTIIYLVNIILILTFLITEIILIYIYLKILRPFRKFSEYPEKIVNMQSVEKLPESKDKFFGKYIWGMNLLADKLENHRKQIHSLEYQRQTLISSIAHGVKTPVANIRLYSSAICEGLYTDGVVNETDARIAEKIDSNAVKIEKITKELLATASAALVSYEPEISLFYIKELVELIENEWKDRLSLKRIPFTVECVGNPIMESDKAALVRAVSQMLENAVKYSDGTGISVTALKEDENFIISVKSKGGLLPEKELPYIFRSFWRGSNAENTEGSGVGLFTVSETIKKLGGKVYARCLVETDEMEFVIFL